MSALFVLIIAKLQTFKFPISKIISLLLVMNQNVKQVYQLHFFPQVSRTDAYLD